jgi:hypothetical protein
VTVAGTPAFEGRAKVAAAPDGQVYVLWEEGEINWGRRYVPGMRKPGKGDFRISDAVGPLHRFRQIRIARLDVGGKVALVDPPLPMPSVQQALARPEAAEKAPLLGVFYERGELTVDGQGRLWVAYRHYYVPWLGRELVTHKESGWGVYARSLTGDGWSRLVRFDVGQGDGMQRLSVVPRKDGVGLAYTAGRTDRQMPDVPRGVAVATVSDPPGAREPLASTQTRTPSGPTIPNPPAPKREVTTVADRQYELFFGDLHRHTDLSLCNVPTDGTIDDAYRYAIDVARLDFLGITDHARDIAQGDVKSQLWWRNCKEVTRHALGPRFFPYFSYERSRGGADHNVISLKPDVLTPFTYPHAKLWTELDDDTFTIPHQTITDPITDPNALPTSIGPEVWASHDNARRPLLEIYQGCRDRSIEHDAHPAWRNAISSGSLPAVIISRRAAAMRACGHPTAAASRSSGPCRPAGRSGPPPECGSSCARAITGWANGSRRMRFLRFTSRRRAPRRSSGSRSFSTAKSSIISPATNGRSR